MIKKKYLFIAFLFISWMASAQSGYKIDGYVKEDGTDVPVAYALVGVKGSDISTLTDSNGYFNLQTKTAGTCVLSVGHLSYEASEITVDGPGTLECRLRIKPVMTETILVVGSPLGEVSQSEIIRDEIKLAGRQKNVADLFMDVNGFNVIKRGAYAMDPVFRSFKYEQLNIQIDGGTKVMNACPNRMDPITTHVITEEIEKIELIRGPFSMRFGPNFGGVINLITQQTPGVEDYGIHGAVHAGYEANGEGKLLGLSVSQASKLFDISLSGELHDFGNYSDGNGTEVPSGFKSYDYSVKAGMNPGKNQRIQALWRQSFGKDVLHAGLPMDTEHDNSSILSLDYKKQNISPSLYSISAKGFYSYVDHLMSNVDRPNFGMVFASTPVFSTTWGGKVELAFTPGKKTVIYTGLDMNIIAREGDRTRTVKRNLMNPEIVFDPPKIFVDSIWQDATLSDYGLFGEAKFMLNPRITVTTGVRVDYVSANIAAPAADFKALYSELGQDQEINISGSLAMAYVLGTGAKLELALGRGVRTATMIERYINHFSVHIDPYEYVGNPELKPEANHQIELSIKGKVQKVNYGAAMFYSYITNYITAAIDANLGRKFMPWLEPKFAKRFQNVEVATQTGFEAFVEVALLKGLSARIDASLTKTKNVDFNEPLPLIAPFTTMASITYKREKFWVDLRSRFSSEQKDIAPSFGESVTPAYKVFDFRAGIQPWKGLSVGFSILNIMDEAFYDHLTFAYNNSDVNSGRIYEPGRNFTVFLKYKF